MEPIIPSNEVHTIDLSTPKAKSQALEAAATIVEAKSQNEQKLTELDFSRKFADLTKQERALFKEKQAIKTKQKELEEKVKDLEAKSSKYSKYDEIIGNRQFDKLEELGVTRQEFLDWAMSQDNGASLQATKHVQEMKKEIDGLKQELSKAQQAQQEREAQRTVAEAKLNIGKELTPFLESEEHEAIKILSEIDGSSPTDFVWNIMVKKFNESPEATEEERMMTVETVVKEVDNLFDKILETLSKSKKLQSRFKVETAKTPERVIPKTLTNSLTAPVARESARLGREESIAAAAESYKRLLAARHAK